MKKLLCLLCLLSSPSLSAPQVIGQAYSLDGSNLLYVEEHTYSEDGKRHAVAYKDAEGKLFASKSLEYRVDATKPGYQFTNDWSRQKIDINLGPESVQFSLASDKGAESGEIRMRQPLVIDAGFDAYIRRHWRSLEQGEPSTFYFLLPTRKRLIKLRVYPSDCTYPSQGDRCFQLRPASRWLGWFVKPVELGYDPDAQRLVRFRGLGNIEDSRGRGLEVDIRYRYRGDFISPV